MALQRDAIATVEAIYQLGGDEQSWLEQVCAAAQGWYGLGLGTIAWTFSLHPPQLGRPVVVGGDESYRVLPERYLAALGADDTRAAYRSGPTTTAIEAFPDGAFERLSPPGIGDFLATLGLSADGTGVLLGAPSAQRIRLEASRHFRSERIAAHLAAAHRLRVKLDSGQLPGLSADHASAVLAPDGELLQAEDAEAQSGDQRQRLRAAVARIDRARAAQRRTAPEEALDAWQGLVDGRWSLLDHFESDGRRYVVALRNPPEVRDPRALTPRERQVAAYAALGYSGKQIAYALGIDPSAISRHLSSAVTKLGLRHAGELPAYLARLVLEAQQPELCP